MEFQLKGAKGRTVSSAAEVISSNEDLVVEILKRVPVKTLSRLRSVCKTWSLLISSPRFSLLYCQRQQQLIYDSKLSGLIFVCRNKSELVCYTPINNNNNNEESLEMFPPDMGVATNLSLHIEDFCNGLILISSQARGGGHSRVYHVSNPITKKISTLPPPSPLPGYPPLYDYVYLLFDPSKSLHYKVVLLLTKVRNDTYYCHIHIYSSETSTWWATSSEPPYPHLFQTPLDSVDFDNGVSCNGNVHWLSRAPSYPHPHLNSLYFDVHHKTFRHMPSPPSMIECGRRRFFGASSGHLHVGYHYYDPVGYTVLIYEMESDYSNWSTKCRFCINQLFLDMDMVVRNYTLSLLNIIRGKDQGDVFLLLLLGINMLYYSVKDHTFNKFHTSNKLQFLPASENDLSWFRNSGARAHPFMETLFPV